jgi:hypothetical protein
MAVTAAERAAVRALYVVGVIGRCGVVKRLTALTDVVGLSQV